MKDITKSFSGKVSFKSSGPAANRETQPPGEAEIHALNPRRIENLKKLTGWVSVEPGTLNLDECQMRKTISSLNLNPDYSEKPEDITYPPEFKHIPCQRGGYSYYMGFIVGINGRELTAKRAVVFRIPKVPGHGLSQRVEAYADVSLQSEYQLREKDTVICALGI